MAEPVHFIIVLPPLGFGFIRDSPDGCRSDLNVRAFAAFLQDRSVHSGAIGAMAGNTEMAGSLEDTAMNMKSAAPNIASILQCP
ncbi:MAG: hypothetical protein ACLQJ0_16685 [Steroidobacteraceae bacterium]